LMPPNYWCAALKTKTSNRSSGCHPDLHAIVMNGPHSWFGVPAKLIA
jgi:hypothetical protein